MEIGVVVLVVASAVIGGFAQILMKKGADLIGETTTLELLKTAIPNLALNPYLILGLLVYAVSTLFYIVALSRGELSAVFPLISISFIVTAILSSYFLGEKLSLMRWAGTIVIVTGVFMVVRS